MDSETVIRALAALAQEHRLAVFRLLVEAGPAGLAAGAVAARLNLPPSSLSFHLAQLGSAGLAHHRRDGRSIIYSADFGAMTAVVAYLTENCCAGGVCEVPASCAPRVTEPSSIKQRNAA